MRASLLIAAVLGLALAACTKDAPEADQANAQSAATEAAGAPPSAPVATDLPAGAYELDEAHSNLTFRVSHLGFSNYTGQFKRFDAKLQFDPQNVPASQVTVMVDPRSLDVNAPPDGFLDTLLNDEWFAAARFPEITFRSTKVEVNGSDKMRIHGELDFRGTTQPVMLDATFNGGYAGHALEPQARIGFSARGTLRRSAFGMKVGVPPPGSTFGVGDDVEFIIETEFTGPPWDRAAERTKN